MFSQKIKVILIYVITFTAVILLINQLFHPGLLSVQNFLNWDAEHYHWIKKYGYKDFRVAFFPLFPLTWKFLHLNIYGIVLFNVAVFAAAFYVLARKLKLNTQELLLYISIPSFCFFFLPYTEALFFACSALLLIGLKDNKFSLVLAGLFLCTLTRPAFTVFIPALILVEIFNGKFNVRSGYKILSYLLLTFLGVLTVGLIQHHYTGEWFKFFEAQKGWGNHLQVPSLPFNSWGGGMILRLDAASLLFGLVSGIMILIKILKPKNHEIPQHVFFSLCYLAGITLSVVLFRGGFLFSLNRFVLATPFIIVAADYYIKHPFRITNRQIVISSVSIFAFWLLFGSYLHITALIAFLALTLYISLILLLKSGETLIPKISAWILVGLNFTFQIILLVKFLDNEWVG